MIFAVVTLAAIMDAQAQPCGTPPYKIFVGPGPEDFELQQNGPRGPRLIISQKDRRHADKPGELLLMDLEGDDREIARIATIKNREDHQPLHPVGISLVEQPNETLLYVIHSNQKKKERWIEKYRVDGDTLRLVEKPLEDPLIKTPNDLVALPNGEIFLSNAGLTRNVFANLFSTVFSIQRGSVVHYDGSKWTPLLKKALFPNGLAIDLSQRYLFINLFGAKLMRIYDREAKSFLADVQLDAHPDNLSWEIPGHVLNVACHRSQYRTGFHIASARFRAPSAGYRIDVQKAISGEQADELLYDLPGFNGSSTALVFRGRIYVSQLIDPHIAVLDCPR